MVDYKAVRFEERYRNSRFDVVLDTIGGARPPCSGRTDAQPDLTLDPTLTSSLVTHTTLVISISAYATPGLRFAGRAALESRAAAVTLRSNNLQLHRGDLQKQGSWASAQSGPIVASVGLSSDQGWHPRGACNRPIHSNTSCR